MRATPGAEVDIERVGFMKPVFQKESTIARGGLDEGGKIVRIGEGEAPFDELRGCLFAAITRQCQERSEV